VPRRSEFIRDCVGSGFSRDCWGGMIIQKPSRLKPLLHVFLFFILFTTPTFADYQTGLDAYNASDYSAAMAQWKEVAGMQPERENLAVHRESLYAIAMLYWQGEGVQQDYGVSAVWLKQAADINHPGAQAKLGYLYTTGQGVPQNYQEAAKWLQLAAQQGDPDARYNLDILEEAGLLSTSIPDISGTVPDPVSAPDSRIYPLPGRDAGEAWILQQDPERYTIQVIALRAPEKLHAFIAEHPDWSPLALYRMTGYAGSLWVMMQGDYADVEAAREAVKSFPGDLRRHGDLWIRKFGMVQSLIE
jgi:TPR repeat protein